AAKFSESPLLIDEPTTAHVDPTTNTTILDPLPGKLMPAQRISPIAVNYMKFFPSPDIPGVVQNFSWVASTATDDNQGNVRVDHNFGSNDRFFARFSISDNDNIPPDWIPGGPTANKQFVTAHTFIMDYTKVLSRKMVLDMRYA